MPMKYPPHPGLSVRHDCLEPLGLSVTEAARKLGVSRKQLSDIVNCRSGISPEMAIRLDKAFGGGADTWYRLQSTWELAQALKKADRIKVERLSSVVQCSPQHSRVAPCLISVQAAVHVELLPGSAGRDGATGHPARLASLLLGARRVE